MSTTYKQYVLESTNGAAKREVLGYHEALSRLAETYGAKRAAELVEDIPLNGTCASVSGGMLSFKPADNLKLSLDCFPHRGLAAMLADRARVATAAGDPQLASVLSEASTVIRVLADTLKDSNDECRSAYQVAARDGNATNWEAHRNCLLGSLQRQHKVMYPTS